MPKKTPVYNFNTLEVGDKMYYDLDRSNMLTVDNQLAALYAFVGPGVTSGWDVYALSLTGNVIKDNTVRIERENLITSFQSNANSYLGKQYQKIKNPDNSPLTENDWAQVIGVSTGNGIVGLYSGATTEPAYFRFTVPNFYYVWAEASVCLATEGKAKISVPMPPTPDYNNNHTATYLATVEVVANQSTGTVEILNIVYGDKRNNLKDLAGALQQALKQAFYHHVHLGGENHPSKINLTTQVILNATAPAGSTIFILSDPTNIFNPSHSYGVPQVLLNNQVLPISAYNLQLGSSRLYLLNSLPQNSLLKVVLPLAPQIGLVVDADVSTISDPVVYLKDSSVSPSKIFIWDSSAYEDPQVYLRNIIQDPSSYSIDNLHGFITFKTPLAGYANADLQITLTKVLYEVTGKLSGKRVKDIDASTFTSGILDTKRLAGLDHVGQIRYLEQSSLRPYLRIFSEGDHKTFYPEIPNSVIQYNTNVRAIRSSVNVGGTLLGTKHGILQTQDFTSFTQQPNWNTDLGEAIQVVDEIHSNTGENHFHKTFILTREGSVFYTTNNGVTWVPLKMPIILTSDTTSITPLATAFYASTEKVEDDNNKIHWSEYLYLGTNMGLWTAHITEGLTDQEWSWTTTTYWRENPQTVYSVAEILTTTQAYISSQNGCELGLTSDKRTVYAGADSGFYIGNSLVSTDIVKGFLWIKTGLAQNNLLWYTDHTVYLTHTAIHHIAGSESECSPDYWTHPLESDRKHQTVVTDLNSVFLNSVQSTTTNQYYVVSNTGIQVIPDIYDTNNNVWIAPVPYKSTWDLAQGLCQDLYVYTNGMNSQFFAASSNGLWTSQDLTTNWTRLHNEFNALNYAPTLYNALTNEVVSGWTLNVNQQSFTFGIVQPIDLNLIYERDYLNYYVAAWNPVGADVLVYINGAPVTVPYTINPSFGQIQFLVPRSPLDNVSVTIIRLNASISNVGTNPHEELFNMLITDVTPSTVLSADLATTGQIIPVKDPLSIPFSTNYIELRAIAGIERIAVTVDPDTRQITASSPRIGIHAFPATYTSVYLVTRKNVLGIEDILSLATSQQTYHFNSRTNNNVLQHIISARKIFPSLLNNFYYQPNSGNRGLKNGLLFDFSVDSLDNKASSSSKYIGIDPSPSDNPSDPNVIYAIYGADSHANGMLIGTDKGIWGYQSSTDSWQKQSELNGATRVYFIKNITPVPGQTAQIIAGTDKGLFVSQNGVWVQNPTFSEPLFDIIPDASMVLPPIYPVNAKPDNAPDPKTWFKSQYTSYGKNDGLAFDLAQSKGFVSDHFDTLDGKKIYSLFKGYYQTTSGGGDSQVTINKTDAIYLCTDDGLWGLTNGSRGGQYSGVLQGREMFVTPNNLFETISLPSGGTESVPIKIYKAFQSTRFKTILLVILTSNGVYTTRNWRWANPIDDSTGTFGIEAHSLAGLRCQCYTAITSKDENNNNVYKEFIGTDKGVYVSYTEGDSWNNCEKISGGASVYDLKSFIASDGKTVVYAATDAGLYYTTDDGDDWKQPIKDGNSYANFSPVVSNGISFSGQSLSQTFKLSSGISQTTKVGIFINVVLSQDNPAYTASLSNQLQAEIHNTDAQGNPSSVIYTSPDLLLASNVPYQGYWYIDMPVSGLDASKTYALVVTENIATGGVSNFKWYRSEISNPYINGNRFGGNSSSWNSFANEDFFFRIYEQTSAVPVATNVDAGFISGENYGTVISDTGDLTTDFKFAIVAIVDDSASMAWSDPLAPDDNGIGNGRRKQEIGNLFDSLWQRTKDGDYLSYADFWVFSFDSEERTTGYSNDLGLLETLSNSLYNNGTQSQIYDTSLIAVSGLNPQSITDAIVSTTNSLTPSRVANIVIHLQKNGLLNLSDIQNWYNGLFHPDPTNVWDGTASTIQNFQDVSNYLIQKWSKTYTPVIFVFSDGSDTTNGDPLDVAISASSNWSDKGIQINSFGLGKGSIESGLRTMSNMTGAKYFSISDGRANKDWQDATNSFLHGGNNNLFTAKWSKVFDYELPVFIQSVNAKINHPTGNIINSSCSVKMRYSTDRINYTNWTDIQSEVPFIINDLILVLEYQVNMSDGWNNNGIASKPSVNYLYHVTIDPSIKYLITQPYSTDGLISEYSLSAAADIPSTSKLQWGIVRGNSTDFADFESVINERKGILANRQQSIQFTLQNSQSGLPTITTDSQKYQVVDANNLPIRWSTTDLINVYAGGFLIDPSRATYQLDGSNGYVYFVNQQPSTVTVTVDIITPPKQYTSIGEPATTEDNKTYKLMNGRWPYDSQVVVLINGNIKRGGFFLNNAEGTATFKKELQDTDLVTVFIQSSSQYRVGVEIQNYDINNDVALDNFGLIYSTSTNLPVLSHYNQTAPPFVKNVAIQPNNNPSIYDRFSIKYDFVSKDGNEEYGTMTSWWRKHANENSFSQINSYNNRTVEKSADIRSLFVSGDSIYVIVTPSDGFSFGSPVQSQTITVSSNQAPVATNPTITSPVLITSTNPDIIGTVKAGKALSATYSYTSNSGNPENGSIVSWYNKDNGGSIFYNQKDIPVNFTQVGQILNYEVVPYDGQNYGLPVDSGIVIIN